MSDYSFVTAWERDDPAHRADAIAFWKTFGMVDESELDERAKALCSLVYCDGIVVGVATVNFREIAALRSRFAFYRCAVHREHRQRDLAILLTRHVIITMEGWSHEHPEEKLNGVATFLEAKELGEKARNPVWAEYYGNLNLVAFTPAGVQVRVAWFRHARLDPTPA